MHIVYCLMYNDKILIISLGELYLDADIIKKMIKLYQALSTYYIVIMV